MTKQKYLPFHLLIILLLQPQTSIAKVIKAQEKWVSVQSASVVDQPVSEPEKPKSIANKIEDYSLYIANTSSAPSKPTSLQSSPPAPKKKRLNYYIGLGGENLKLNEVNVRTSENEQLVLNNNPNMLMLIIGASYLSAKSSNFIDVGFISSSSENPYGNRLCYTQIFGTNSYQPNTCAVDYALNIATLPATYNFATADGTFFAGVGGTLYHLKQKIAVGNDDTHTDSNGQKYELESKTLYRNEMTGVAPMVQIGGQYKKFRLRASYTDPIGDETTGEGSTAKLALEWVFNK